MFAKVVSDIKNLKIQGAEHIARSGANSLHHIMKASSANSAPSLMSELRAAEKKLIQARPTEPCLRNALSYVLNNTDKGDIVRLIRSVDENIKNVNSYFKSSDLAIAEIGFNKVKHCNVVFTHCHSTTVMTILAKVKFSRHKFEVHNTETRPKLQGRLTAKELSALGIKVYHFVDSAARLALKNSDIFLFGADAIQSDGTIINKIGTELMLEVAHRYDIPSYCCTVAWKYSPRTKTGEDEPIENRSPKEVWVRPPKNVTIMNPAFEKVDPRLVTGVISELGVFRPQTFVDEARRAYQWLSY